MAWMTCRRDARYPEAPPAGTRAGQQR